MNATEIRSVTEYINSVKKDTMNWIFERNNGRPWFRGQLDAEKPPIPSVFRRIHNGFEGVFDEFNLTRMFRERSSVLGLTPNRSEIDKWLFLMQHHGLPTRLIDWSEGSLIGLFFATFEESTEDRAVWMIHPLELNYYSLGHKEFPNTWTENNHAYYNFTAAFGVDKDKQTTLPVSINTTYCDNRMFSQKSCFTIHGSDERDFENLFATHKLNILGYFRKYIIPKEYAQKIQEELILLGIDFSTIYPDLDGLAKEIKSRYFIKRT